MEEGGLEGIRFLREARIHNLRGAFVHNLCAYFCVQKLFTIRKKALFSRCENYGSNYGYHNRSFVGDSACSISRT